jgi:hypothetical protein
MFCQQNKYTEVVPKSVAIKSVFALKKSFYAKITYVHLACGNGHERGLSHRCRCVGHALNAEEFNR